MNKVIKKFIMMALIATAAMTANAQDVKKVSESKNNAKIEMQTPGRKDKVAMQRNNRDKQRKNFTPEQFADRRLKRMANLNLSDSQKSKLRSIYMDEAKKKQAHREEMRKMDADFQKKVEKVLTNEQRAKYSNMKGKKARHQKQGRGANGGKRNMKKACPQKK